MPEGGTGRNENGELIKRKTSYQVKTKNSRSKITSRTNLSKERGNESNSEEHYYEPTRVIRDKNRSHSNYIYETNPSGERKKILPTKEETFQLPKPGPHQTKNNHHSKNLHS